MQVYDPVGLVGSPVAPFLEHGTTYVERTQPRPLYRSRVAVVPATPTPVRCHRIPLSHQSGPRQSPCKRHIAKPNPVLIGGWGQPESLSISAAPGVAQPDDASAGVSGNVKRVFFSYPGDDLQGERDAVWRFHHRHRGMIRSMDSAVLLGDSNPDGSVGDQVLTTDSQWAQSVPTTSTSYSFTSERRLPYRLKPLNNPRPGGDGYSLSKSISSSYSVDAGSSQRSVLSRHSRGIVGTVGSLPRLRSWTDFDFDIKSHEGRQCHPKARWNRSSVVGADHGVTPGRLPGSLSAVSSYGTHWSMPGWDRYTNHGSQPTDKLLAGSDVKEEEAVTYSVFSEDRLSLMSNCQSNYSSNTHQPVPPPEEAEPLLETSSEITLTKPSPSLSPRHFEGGHTGADRNAINEKDLLFQSVSHAFLTYPEPEYCEVDKQTSCSAMYDDLRLINEGFSAKRRKGDTKFPEVPAGCIITQGDLARSKTTDREIPVPKEPETVSKEDCIPLQDSDTLMEISVIRDDPLLSRRIKSFKRRSYTLKDLTATFRLEMTKQNKVELDGERQRFEDILAASNKVVDDSQYDHFARRSLPKLKGRGISVKSYDNRPLEIPTVAQGGCDGNTQKERTSKASCPAVLNTDQYAASKRPSPLKTKPKLTKLKGAFTHPRLTRF